MLLLAAACQPVPRPFGRDSGAKTNPLLGLRNAEGVTVVHVDGAPPRAARALTREMSAALIELNLPATNKSANRRGLFLIGHAESYPIPGNMLRVRLRWELLNAQGRAVGNRIAIATINADSWKEGVARALLPLVRRPALDIASAVNEPATAARKERAQRFPLYVAPVAGGPDAGNRALTEAMFRSLKVAGFNVSSVRGSNGYIIAGTVNLGPTADGKRTVQIVWSILDVKGKTMGRINQGNRVPAAALNGPWDGMARSVTRGAVPGVRNLLRRIATQRNETTTRTRR